MRGVNGTPQGPHSHILMTEASEWFFWVWNFGQSDFLGLNSLRCSRTCQLFLNVNIVPLQNGSRKRVHGAISHYGPRSSAWLSTWLFSCFLIENQIAAIEEERWKRAVTRQFNIENLLEEQQKSLRDFLGGHNIFVNLPTGFGKSLIFQCLPIAADALFAGPRGSSVVVWWDDMPTQLHLRYTKNTVPALC